MLEKSNNSNCIDIIKEIISKATNDEIKKMCLEVDKHKIYYKYVINEVNLI